MPLTLSLAKESDVERIADIHMASFGTNLMLRAQFPTPASCAALHLSLMDKARSEIRDPQWEVLVVHDQDAGKIISFAKWKRPLFDEDYVEVPWTWPEGSRMDILDEWTRKVEDVAGRVIGDTPCYCLSFIGTDPKYERRGAATMLVQWGLERSVRENVPVQLESTMVACPLYEKLGFKAKEDIRMLLEGVGDDGEDVLYEEMSLVFSPGT